MKIFLFLLVITLFLFSPVVYGAERNYINIGADPVDVSYCGPLTRTVVTEEALFMRVGTGSGGTVSGWIPAGTKVSIVFDGEDERWRIDRICECGNPVFNKIFIRFVGHQEATVVAGELITPVPPVVVPPAPAAPVNVFVFCPPAFTPVPPALAPAPAFTPASPVPAVALPFALPIPPAVTEQAPCPPFFSIFARYRHCFPDRKDDNDNGIDDDDMDPGGPVGGGGTDGPAEDGGGPVGGGGI